MEPENRSIIWKLNDEILIISILIIVTLTTLLLTIFTNIFVLSFIFYPATILPIFYLNRRKYNMDFKLSLISLGFINPSKYTQFKSFFFNSIYPYLLALSYWVIGLLFVGIWYYFINSFSINLFYPPAIENFIPQISSKSFFIFCTVAILIAPISEEILFRGFLLNKFHSKYGHKNSILITSVIFALFHMHLGAIVPVFILGMSIGWIKIKTRSLLPCIYIHIIQNSLAIILTITNT